MRRPSLSSTSIRSIPLMTWSLVTMWPSLLTMAPLPCAPSGDGTALVHALMEKAEKRVVVRSGAARGAGAGDADHRRDDGLRQEHPLAAHGGQDVHVGGVDVRRVGDGVLLGTMALAVRRPDDREQRAPQIKPLRAVPWVFPNPQGGHRHAKQQHEEQEAKKAFHQQRIRQIRLSGFQLTCASVIFRLSAKKARKRWFS